MKEKNKKLIIAWCGMVILFEIWSIIYQNTISPQTGISLWIKHLINIAGYGMFTFFAMSWWTKSEKK